MTPKTPSEHFWQQLTDYLSMYGLPLFVTSVVTGFLLGYGIHYFVNIIPLKKSLKKEREIAEKENSERSEKAKIITEEDEKFSGRMMNVSSFRKNVTYKYEKEPEKSEETDKLLSNNQENNTEESGSETDGELVDEEGIHVVEESKPREVDGDRLIKAFGTLHGKLATAQLKAKTRQMEARMSAAEKEHENEMKAQQMRGIMELMMKNKEKFGMSNEEDVAEQLNLYSF